jgi:eukaryotic-like serine/threonine-protein kinase
MPRPSIIMRLSRGSRVGVYEIGALIGQGGMGVVYQAVDTRLNRPVAVKVLAADVANAAARRRFQREAETASSLNHPHIVTVYDAGEIEGRQYLVTEWLDGGTLRDWLSSGSRSWRASVELLIGVADALAAAHQAGILHRDIKPENILLTKTGYAKLADFGLAKLQVETLPDAVTRSEWSQTRPGSLIGTIAYMSPEQAEGRALDARSDVFSFGLVLYEALGGRRPFDRNSEIDLLHAIVHDEPPPLPPVVPEPLRRVVEKILEKAPDERYQSMRDVVVDLRRTVRRTIDHGDPSVRRRTSRWLVAAAVTVLVPVVTWFVAGRRAPAAPPPEYSPLTTFADSVTSPALSPDGGMLAMVRANSAFSTAPAEIFVKHLPDGEVRQLTNDGLPKWQPAFAPDGKRIAYHTSTDGKMLDTWIVPVDGGRAQLFAKNASGVTWIPPSVVTQAERIVFSEFTGHGFQMSVVAADENGGRRRTVYLPPEDGMAHRSALSPDGRWLLVVEMDARSWLPCRLVPFDASTRGAAVGPAGSMCTRAAWSPDGQWMFFSANTGKGYHTWRQRFPDGTPQQLTFGATEEDEISVDPDGRSFVAAIGNRQSTVWLHDASGDRQLTSEGFAFLPTISPDGAKVYYLVENGNSRGLLTGGLWSVDIASQRRRRLFPQFDVLYYSVSNDGRTVVFTGTDDHGQNGVWVGAVDEASTPRAVTRANALLVLFGAANEVVFSDADFIYRIGDTGGDPRKVSLIPRLHAFSVSPDGRWLSAAEGPSPETRNALMLYPMAGGEPRLICRCYPPPNIADGPEPPPISWSPDGKFMYVKFEDSTFAIPLRPRQLLPDIPATGWPSKTSIAAMPGARLVSQHPVFPGQDPDTYAYMQVTAHQNIYRVPLR